MKKIKHFLTGEELSASDTSKLLDSALRLKKGRAEGYGGDLLKAIQLALIFEKPSLRTRFSFTVAINELGGDAIEITSAQRKKEEPEDCMRVLNGFVHAVMIRTHADDDLVRMKEYARIPIINGLTDLHHPCQSLADILTLQEEYGDVQGRTITYIGDGNNILHSLFMLAVPLGINIHYYCPKGYEPDSKIVSQVQALGNEVTNEVATQVVEASVPANSEPTCPETKFGSIKSFMSPEAAVVGADAVYTDVFTSMGFEAEISQRQAAFGDLQVNENLMLLANPGAIVLHCLPMVRGQEISKTLPESKNSRIFRQSENRLHVQKSLLVYLLTGDWA